MLIRTINMEGGKILIDDETHKVFSEPGILEKASIELPLVSELCHELRQYKDDVPMVLTNTELQKLIL